MPRTSPRDLAARLLVGVVCVFASLSKAEFTQFTSNQHTYLAHALAIAEFPETLGRDWFVNTLDPVPVFTRLSVPLLRWGALSSANVVLGVIFLATLSALSGVMAEDRPRVRLVASAIFGIVAVGGGLLRRIAFDGVANQQAYSPYWQPANFGVFLVVAVWLAFSDAFAYAVVVASVAAWVHPTYVVSALVFTVGLCASIAWADKQGRRATIVGLLGFVCVLPPAALAYATFLPTSPSIAHRAAELLVTERLPHHANAGSWVGWLTVVQCLPVMFASIVCRGQRRVMLISWFVITIVVSLVAALRHSAELDLLFPWRTSVWLVPACSAIAIGVCTSAALRYFAALRLERYLVAAALLGLFAVGVSTLARKHGTDDFRGVRLARAVAEGERRKWTTVVPPDWEGLRLNAPISIFVDFKSHPYKDVEVLEWHRRLVLARAVYASDRSACHALDTLLVSDARVGFVLAPPSTDLAGCARAALAVRDADGYLFKIRGRTAPGVFSAQALPAGGAL